MIKNKNGIRIQCYSCLIVYVILHIRKIFQEIKKKLSINCDIYNHLLMKKLAKFGLKEPILPGKKYDNRIRLSKNVKFWIEIQHFCKSTYQKILRALSTVSSLGSRFLEKGLLDSIVLPNSMSVTAVYQKQ